LPNTTVADVGEHALIARIRARLTMPSWVVVGPGDDAAVLRPERGALDVVTTDALVEGVHFDRRFVPPDAIGHRALAVNLSDLAAMGAKPRAALLSLVLPDTLEVSALDGLLDGFLALAARHGVTLVGGNITRSPGPLVIDVTAMGSGKPRRTLTRAGARPGDSVYVTGVLGEAAAGLKRLQASGFGVEALPSGPDVERYLRPEPRVRAGILLGQYRVATSCMDLSDGLADGARQIAEASRVGIVLDASAIPTAPVDASRVQAGQDPLDLALSGGDDYELIFTVRPRKGGRLRGVRQQLGNLPITRIGVVTKARDLLVASPDGTTRGLPTGFQHFR
jgi:thiamine-monophosphate kinase